jgi:hypothetical protein
MQRISRISADSGKIVPKTPTIGDGSAKIPYAGEQGDLSTHRENQVPCSADNRDLAGMTRRLPLENGRTPGLIYHFSMQ